MATPEVERYLDLVVEYRRRVNASGGLSGADCYALLDLAEHIVRWLPFLASRIEALERDLCRSTRALNRTSS